MGSRSGAAGIFVLVACVGVSAICLLRSPSITRAQAAGAAVSPELAKLQQEQIATLQQGSDLATQMFMAGTGSVEEADRFNHMLIEAKLRAATTPTECTEVLEKGLAAAKSQEGIAQQKAKMGLATMLVPVEAKAYRLGIEIELAEEKGK